MITVEAFVCVCEVQVLWIDEFHMVLGGQPAPFCFYPLSTRKQELRNTSASTASNIAHQTN